jgi:MSHA biogenesis protein MshE
VERRKFFSGAGCTFCNLTGFRGRTAVYEVLEMDRPLAEKVRRGDLDGFVRTALAKESYVPLVQGAIDLVLAGVTSLAEAMALGSGLDELIDGDAVLDEPAVEKLLEQRA